MKKRPLPAGTPAGTQCARASGSGGCLTIEAHAGALPVRCSPRPCYHPLQGRWSLEDHAGGRLGPSLASSPGLAAQLQAAAEADGRALVVVEDAAAHALLASAPAAAWQPGVRFFAAAVLQGRPPRPGRRAAAALCILDSRPRRFEPDLLASLASFASLAAVEVERALEQQAALSARACAAAVTAAAEQEARQLQAALRQAGSLGAAALLVDVRRPEWPILFANPAWAAATGISVQRATSGAFWSLLQPWSGAPDTAGAGGGGSGNGAGAAAAALQRTALAAIAAGVPVSVYVAPADAPALPLRVSLRPATVAAAAAGDAASLSPCATAPGGNAGAQDRSACSSASAASTTNGCSTSSLAPTAPPAPRPGPFWIALAQGPDAAAAASKGAPLPPGSGVSLPPPRLAQLRSQGAVAPEAFAEVELGPVLGSGAHGRVHRALWRGVPVAVKVRRRRASRGLGKRRRLAWAALGLARVRAGSGRGRCQRCASAPRPRSPHTVHRPALLAPRSWRRRSGWWTAMERWQGRCWRACSAATWRIPTWCRRTTTRCAARRWAARLLLRGRGAFWGGGEAGACRAARAGGLTGKWPPPHTHTHARAQVTNEQGLATRVQHVMIVQQFATRGTLIEGVRRGLLAATRAPGGPPNSIAILQTAQEIASALCYLVRLRGRGTRARAGAGAGEGRSAPRRPAGHPAAPSPPCVASPRLVLAHPCACLASAARTGPHPRCEGTGRACPRARPGRAGPALRAAAAASAHPYLPARPPTQPPSHPRRGPPLPTTGLS